MNHPTSTVLLASCVVVAGCTATHRTPEDDRDPDDAGAAMDAPRDLGTSGRADCVEGACVECTAATASTDCAADAPRCDPALHRCVECVEHGDCRADVTKPVCIDGACGACTSDEECAGRAPRPVCDEPTGRCVGCAADAEQARCGRFSCSLVRHTCTTTTRRSLHTCDRCEADSECPPDHGCVLHAFGSAMVGYFCFPRAVRGQCEHARAIRGPCPTPVELLSLDGSLATYCLPPAATTCQGLRDSQSVACTHDEDCGIANVNDGYCAPTPAGTRLCSYRCDDDADCGDILTCDGDPPRCQP